MSLSADATQRTRSGNVIAIPGAGSTTFYAGALVGVVSGTGYCVRMSDTANLSFLGVVMTQTVNSGASDHADVAVDTSGVIFEKVTVTGATSVVAVGGKVFATADDTLTLTATSNTKPVGVVTRYYSGSIVDVKLMTPSEYMAARA